MFERFRNRNTRDDYVDERGSVATTTRRDTDGNGKADERRVVLHGFGTEDSHHAIHAFTWGPGGDLYFQECFLECL